MKKTALILLIITMTVFTGCKENKKNIYLPEAENDKIYTTIGGNNGMHIGDGYTLIFASENFRYEKEYDDGNLEEKWEHTKKDDVEIKVTTYKNKDEITARKKFLKDNDEYVFEDLTHSEPCGKNSEGDLLCFRVIPTKEDVFIISWEYPNNSADEVKKELWRIYETFAVTK